MSSCSVADQVIKIDCDDGSIYVARNILCERSKETKDFVRDNVVDIDDSLSHMPERGAVMEHKRAWELYVGFLHGHPIWTRSPEHSIEEDFYNLVQIREFAETDASDFDVMNAAMDAIRELVTQHSDALHCPSNVFGCGVDNFDEDPVGIFLMEYMLFDNFSGVFKKWYSCDDERLDEGLSSILKQTAEAVNGHKPNKGDEKSDLMERCRFHSHGSKPCYLDK